MGHATTAQGKTWIAAKKVLPVPDMSILEVMNVIYMPLQHNVRQASVVLLALLNKSVF
jgi:hypothetical protein